MGLKDIFKKKKQAQVERVYPINLHQNSEYPGYTVMPNEERVNEILKEEVESFFPTTGKWQSSCFERPTELKKVNLPCNLQSNRWIARLLEEELLNKGILICPSEIEQYLNESERFAELKHNYELEIVRWQINHIMSGGNGWIMPKGYDDMEMLVGHDIHNMVRGGVVNTLLAIGIDKEAIEEGIEKNSNLWFRQCMNQSFSNLFEPHYYGGSPEADSVGHRLRWCAAREYEYYQNHKESVDKYGEPTIAMKAKLQDYIDWTNALKDRDAERLAYIEEWKKTAKDNPMQRTAYYKYVKERQQLEYQAEQENE